MAPNDFGPQVKKKKHMTEQLTPLPPAEITAGKASRLQPEGARSKVAFLREASCARATMYRIVRSRSHWSPTQLWLHSSAAGCTTDRDYYMIVHAITIMTIS